MIKVAIIEDDLRYRYALSRSLDLTSDILVKCLWDNVEAANRQIIDLHVDVVLVDIDLSGTTGIDLIKALKRKSPTIQFLALAILDDDETVFEVLRAGASGYILKNDGFEVIIQGIRAVVNGGVPMNSKIARKVISFFHNEPERKEDVLLTAREKEVLRYLSLGRLYKEVAADLNISITTVKKHVSHIYSKLEAQNRTEAINKWVLMNKH